MEDVIKLISQFEAESASRQKVMQSGSLTDHEQRKYCFHLQLNAEIVEELRTFLR
jgi:hypothetical protein